MSDDEFEDTISALYDDCHVPHLSTRLSGPLGSEKVIVFILERAAGKRKACANSERRHVPAGISD